VNVFFAPFVKPLTVMVPLELDVATVAIGSPPFDLALKATQADAPVGAT
jgi:hypothetical protein